MFQKFIDKFFGTSREIVKIDSMRAAFMQTSGSKSSLLVICLSAALLFTLFLSYSAQADMLAATDSRAENSSAFQSGLSISPIAPDEQDAVVSSAGSSTGASANTSTAAGSTAADGVFHQADEELFPISSGKQVNQTSLVLVGAVLIALTMVVGLAIGRKES